MKIRINLQIDVTKLDKSRFYKGEKGTYCNITTVIDLDNADQYGNHGFITQSKNKDEPKDLQLPILGNGKIVWREEQQAQQHNPVPASQQPAPPIDDDLIPF